MNDLLPLPTMLEKLLGSDEDDWPPEAQFVVAAHHGNVRRLKEIARSLDENGKGIIATVATTTYRGMNALHAAGGLGKLPVYRYLVEKVKMDVNKPDTSPSSKKTPLEHAMASGNLPAVRYLLDHGADLHQESEANITVLHRAAEKGRCEIVKLLLSRGAHVDAKSEHGTPLHFAALRGHDSTLEVLLEHHADAGADVNGVNNFLARAAENGLTEAIKWLLEAGANPNTPDSYGRVPIELAAVYGTRKDVEILFPFTTPIPTVANWSVDGLISHVKVEIKQLEDDDIVQTRKSELKQHGDDAFEKQDYANASVWYTKALKVDPSDATLLANRSLCWLRLGDGEKALEDATRCENHHPKWAEGYHRRGAALMFLKEYEKACEEFTRGLELDPENDEMDKLFWEAMELKQK